MNACGTAAGEGPVVGTAAADAAGDKTCRIIIIYMNEEP